MTNETRYDFTISDLEARTGINRRTIHFYVKEGILPAPQGAGGGARYGEEHLLRLQLTRELQKSHLKLSGIREAMDGMTLAQMRAMAKKAGTASKPWDTRALDDWLNTRVRQAVSGPAWNRSLLDLAGPPAPSAFRSPGTAGATGETWERITVADGFEVLLRSDLADAYRQIVAQLADRVSGPGTK
jgi:DNA-binding transcriptional MerR regulator